MSGVITDGKPGANGLRTFRLAHSEVDNIGGEAGETLSIVSDNIARSLEIEWNLAYQSNSRDKWFRTNDRIWIVHFSIVHQAEGTSKKGTN